MLYGVQFSFIDHIMESFLLGMTLWEFFCMWRLNSVDMWTFLMGEICLEESLWGPLHGHFLFLYCIFDGDFLMSWPLSFECIAWWIFLLEYLLGGATWKTSRLVLVLM